MILQAHSQAKLFYRDQGRAVRMQPRTGCD